MLVNGASLCSLELYLRAPSYKLLLKKLGHDLKLGLAPFRLEDACEWPLRLVLVLNCSPFCLLGFAIFVS